MGIRPERLNRFRFTQENRIGGNGRPTLVHDQGESGPFRTHWATKAQANGRASSADKSYMGNEALVQKQLGRHPNILRCFGAGEIDGQPLLVMQRLAGYSVWDLRTACQGGKLTQKQAVTITRQTAEALRHVHDRGLVHCDVKTGNLAVTGRNGAGADLLTKGPAAVQNYLGLVLQDPASVKLFDFALARPEGKLFDFERGATRSAGTPVYQTSSRFFNQPPRKKDDLFALGLTMWEMLAGEILIDRWMKDLGITLAATLFQTCCVEEGVEEAIKASGLPKSLEILLCRLTGTANKRYSPFTHGGEVGDYIDRYLGNYLIRAC